MQLKAENHGSLWLLRGRDALAEEWLEEHLPEDAPRLGDAYAVEARYVEDILRGFNEALGTVIGEKD